MGPLTRVLEHRLDTSLEAEFALPIVQIHSQTYARFPIFCNPSIGSLTTHGKHTGFFHHHEVFGEGDEAKRDTISSSSTSTLKIFFSM